ncbi:MAG: hypothetical protein U0R70_01440 [Solirubrobacteraceae bacterium]
MAATARFTPTRQPYPHLPPGHEPGPQTRRRGAGAVIGRSVGTVVGLGCLGVLYIPIAIVAAAGVLGILRNGFSGIASLIALACLALAVGIPAGAWIAYRRARGAKPGFDLAARPIEAQRGQDIEAAIRITDPAAASGDVEIGLVCTAYYDRWAREASGDAARRRVTAEGIAYEDWREVPATLGAQQVRFAIPPDAPFSHEGECLSFAWRVTARTHAALARDPHHDVALWVSP